MCLLTPGPVLGPPEPLTLSALADFPRVSGSEKVYLVLSGITRIK